MTAHYTYTARLFQRSNLLAAHENIDGAAVAALIRALPAHQNRELGMDGRVDLLIQTLCDGQPWMVNGEAAGGKHISGRVDLDGIEDAVAAITADFADLNNPTPWILR